MNKDVKVVLDAHFDMLLDVLMLRRRGDSAVLEKRFLPGFRSAGVNAIVCSLYVVEELIPEGALRNALDQISALQADLEESPSFCLCRNAAECRAAVADGRVALFLSLEGAEPLGCDPLLLRIFHELGVRLLGLAWSRRNYLCDGVSFEPRPEWSQEGALTDFGRAVVKEARSLGMVLDVSHLNDAGFREIAATAEEPFIASHSNCRALCGSPRNLADWQLAELARVGGVTGMNAYGPFAADEPGERKPEALLAHLDHVVKTAGVAHAGMGLDLCGCLKSLEGGCDPACGRDLFAGHAEAGRDFIARVRGRFDEASADAILGGNFMKVFEKVMR